jgi:hypothetical protein
LATYTLQVQRLLHDLNFQFWQQPELTDYINEARNKVAEDSKCLRQLVTGLNLTAQTEVYTPQSFIGALGTQYLDVMGITLYFGTLRYKLGQLSFTNFDARFRRYQFNFQRPVCFARQGAAQVWFGPNPDQVYVTDWDIAIIPAALSGAVNEVETLPIPFQSPVKYYAAHLAKFKEQAQGEAEIFKQAYWTRLKEAYRSFQTRIIPDPYSIGM